jgi:hypothetical protein
MSAQIAQRFAAIDRRSNGSHRVSLVYSTASNSNPNPIPSSRSPSSHVSPLAPSLDPPPLLPLYPADFTPAPFPPPPPAPHSLAPHILLPGSFTGVASFLAPSTVPPYPSLLHSPAHRSHNLTGGGDGPCSRPRSQLVWVAVSRNLAPSPPPSLPPNQASSTRNPACACRCEVQGPQWHPYLPRRLERLGG